MWSQTTLTLPAYSRGCHIVTRHIVDALDDLHSVNVGLLNLFILHTSASLSINENADPDVPIDLRMALDQIAPETLPYDHTCEGPDDMPAHVKATLTGCSLTIPVNNGRLVLGTWQGIYLCEHRNHGGRRRVALTLQGE